MWFFKRRIRKPLRASASDFVQIENHDDYQSQDFEKEAIFVDQTKEQQDETQQSGRTFTTFFLGTCSKDTDHQHDYFPTGELVAALLNNIEGELNVDYAFVNGPGTDNSDHHLRWAPPTSSGQTLQLLRGAGRRNDVEHILAVISGVRRWWPKEDTTKKQPIDAERLKTLPPITTINILTWSRGGARGMEFCHAIQEILDEIRIIKVNPALYYQTLRMRLQEMGDLRDEEIEKQIILLQDEVKRFEHIKEVNFFSPDMVTGFGSSNKKMTRLTPIVKNYESANSLHEYSFGFSAGIPSPAPHADTNVFHSFEPGHHAVIVGSDRTRKGMKVPGYDLSTVGLIVRDRAEKFLQRNGTKFKAGTTLNYTNEKILELYEVVKVNLPGYEQQKNDSYTWKQFFKRHRKCTVHYTLSNVAYSEIPTVQHDENARKKGYVSSYHEKIAWDFKEELIQKYGKNFAIVIEQAKLLQFQFNANKKFETHLNKIKICVDQFIQDIQSYGENMSEDNQQQIGIRCNTFKMDLAKELQDTVKDDPALLSSIENLIKGGGVKDSIFKPCLDGLKRIHAQNAIQAALPKVEQSKITKTHIGFAGLQRF